LAGFREPCHYFGFIRFSLVPKPYAVWAEAPRGPNRVSARPNPKLSARAWVRGYIRLRLEEEVRKNISKYERSSLICFHVSMRYASLFQFERSFDVGGDGAISAGVNRFLEAVRLERNINIQESDVNREDQHFVKM